MLRKFIVAGNWKMNGNIASISKLCNLLKTCPPDPCKTDLVIGLPYVYLQQTKCLLPESVKLAAQNCYKMPSGPFTGEISATMLKDIGTEWVILGHSERRQIFGECIKSIGEKVAHATTEGMKVIVCVGETKSERQCNQTEEVIKQQMDGIIKNVQNWSDVVFAYEPVWAIGSGEPATSEEAQHVHCVMRSYLGEKVSQCVAKEIRIQYGGSVTEKNCKSLIAQPDIDGFLVGGASMEPQFTQIIQCSPPSKE